MITGWYAWNSPVFFAEIRKHICFWVFRQRVRWQENSITFSLTHSLKRSDPPLFTLKVNKLHWLCIYTYITILFLLLKECKKYTRPQSHGWGMKSYFLFCVSVQNKGRKKMFCLRNKINMINRKRAFPLPYTVCRRKYFGDLDHLWK